MYVKKSGYKGKTYLSLVEEYRIDGKVRHKTIEKLAYLEDLEKLYDDPITHLRKLLNRKIKKRLMNSL